MMSRDISQFPVMKQKCATCPFNTEDKGRHNDPELVDKIKQRILSQTSQICHHPVLSDKEESHLCRGARDYQIEIFKRIGFLEEATNEAWEKKRKQQTLL